jgi:Xaa-Pro aminopeptidase
MAKEHHEVRVIAEAARLLDIGMESGQRAIREAATEVEVHNAIEDALRRLGFSGQMIVCVASGERSDRPHMATSTRTLRPGDVLWIDIAVEHRGYFARIARTFVLGQMSAELAEVYQVVLAAQQALREGANPGMTGAQIQSRAAAIVHKRGFGDHCSHKAGHGIGLELYEQPELVPQADEPLPENTTLCVEAGIYLPAIGGVKIADSVGMFAEGSCSLTRFRRNLSTPKSKYVV